MIVDIDPFDVASLTAAEKRIQNLKESLPGKVNRIIDRLAIMGTQEASLRFSTAQYDGDNDVLVSLEPIPKGYSILAKGNAAPFIEFGSGVYHNPGGTYPLPRPEGIAHIGEYGKGNGSKQAWVYKGNVGTNGLPMKNGRVLTRGNPASMPLWYARASILRNIGNVVREEFAHD